MEDYKVPFLAKLINEVLNPIHEKSREWTVVYLLFHALIYYFEYAVGAVRSQERALQDKEADAMIVSSAMGAYVNMATCFVLLDRALEQLSLASGKKFRRPKDLKVLEGSRGTWKNSIRDKRDRFAHPEEDKGQGPGKGFFILSKRNMVSSDGTVRIRQVSVKEPKNGQLIFLTPRTDVENLRGYLSDVATLIMEEVERVVHPTD